MLNGHSPRAPDVTPGERGRSETSLMVVSATIHDAGMLHINPADIPSPVQATVASAM
jgi:hypothetical protein